MRHLLTRGLLSLAVAISSSCFAQTTDEAPADYKPKITITLQSAYPEKFPLFLKEKKWTDSILEKTEGEVKFDLVPVETISEPTGSLDAIELGVLDGHFTYFGYLSHNRPEYILLSDMVGVTQHPERVAEFLNSDDGRRLMQSVRNDSVTYVGGFTTGFDSLSANKEIKSMKDMKEVNIRVPEGIASTVFKALGANTQNILLSEALPALKSGQIDMADVSFFAINQKLGIHKAATYPIYSQFHSMPVFELAIYTDKWQKISPKSQKVIQDDLRDYAKLFLVQNEKENKHALKIAQADEKVNVVFWENDALNEFYEFAKLQRAKLTEKSKKARTVEATLQRFSK